MNTVPLDTAILGLYAVAALAFCLGFVAASVMQMRPSRHVPAAPRTDVRITATGRRERRAGERFEPTYVVERFRSRRGPRDWPTE